MKNLNEIKNLKFTLERKLEKLIGEAVLEFFKETGIVPDDVYVSLAKLNSMGTDNPVDFYTKCRIRIDI